MNSPNDFQFVLYPWENRGVLFSPHPHFVGSAVVQGHLHLFLLKIRANRVFFRLAEDETRIWATTREIEGEPVSFWKREVEAGRIARLFTYKGRLDVTRGYKTTEAGVLVSAEDEVWFCEWCSDIWLQGKATPGLQKYTRTHRRLGVWYPQWQPPLRKLWNHNAKLLFDRPMPQVERETTSFRWVCGSQEQLDELLYHVCLVCYGTLERAEQELRAIYSYHTTSYGRVDDRWYFALRSDSLESKASLSFGWYRGDPHLEILDVFLQHNRAIGVDWTRGNVNSVRGEWDCSSYVCYFTFARRQPTSLQRTESRHFLRQWLHGKVPDSKIEEWLTPQG